MHKIYFMILFLLLPFIVQAETKRLEWDPVQNASGYKIYLSTDNGATWDSGTDIGSGISDGDRLYAEIDLPETGLVLIKISAYNAAGETRNDWQGAWFNKTWQPPDSPGGAGLQ